MVIAPAAPVAFRHSFSGSVDLNVSRSISIHGSHNIRYVSACTAWEHVDPFHSLEGLCKRFDTLVKCFNNNAIGPVPATVVPVVDYDLLYFLPRRPLQFDPMWPSPSVDHTRVGVAPVRGEPSVVCGRGPKTRPVRVLPTIAHTHASSR